MAAVGYGTGGNIALELGRAGADLRAIFACNPSLEAVRPADSAKITGQVLVCVGSEDPIVAPEQHAGRFQADMQQASVDWQLNIYGGAEHAFHHPPTNPDQKVLPGVSYHHAHAQRAWRAMLDLFDEAFG